MSIVFSKEVSLLMGMGPPPSKVSVGVNSRECITIYTNLVQNVLVFWLELDIC